MEAGYEAIADAAVGVFTVIGIILVISIVTAMIGIVFSIIGLIRKLQILKMIGFILMGIGGVPTIFVIGTLIFNAITYYLHL